MEDRKPAKRRSEIDESVLRALNCGSIQTKNLVEWLSIDRITLLENQLEWIPRSERKTFCEVIESDDRELIQSLSPLKQSFQLGLLLTKTMGIRSETFTLMSQHSSDVIREIAAVMIGEDSSLTFAKRLAWIKPFADDSNPGVREIAWLSLRKYVQADLEKALKCLVPWTGSRNERLRRYASEITRPRGVWCQHLNQLKDNLDLGLPILDPLCADESDYVQKSVANWINDASKSNAKWAVKLTNRWSKESKSLATEKIVKRALRTLRKIEESQ